MHFNRSFCIQQSSSTRCSIWYKSGVSHSWDSLAASFAVGVIGDAGAASMPALLLSVVESPIGDHVNTGLIRVRSDLSAANS